MKVYYISFYFDVVQYFLDKLNRILVYIFDIENDFFVFLISLMEMYILGMVEVLLLFDLILDVDIQKFLEIY